MHNRKKIAEKFAKAIKSEYIKEIILYGSVARGEDKEDSDIDILIITDYYDNLEDKIADEVVKVIFDDDEYISTQIMTVEHFEKTKNFSFLTNVLKEGVTIGWTRRIF